MQRILGVVGVAAFLATFLFSIGAHAATVSPARLHAPMKVTILRSSGPTKLDKRGLMTLHLKVQGLILDAKEIGKKPVSGRGHIQVYLDRVPSEAYRVPALMGMVAISAGRDFTVNLSKVSHGRHTLIVVLAQNNYVLYRGINPARFSLTV